MKKLTYFVPVDFTDCSYNALQYAIMLARFSEGQVKLCHVINMEQIPDSDNQVVVTRSLNELNRKATKKMKSLVELTAMEGVHVDEILVMGNVKGQLLEQIEKVNPHVIVIGRNTERQPTRRSIATYLTRNTQVPVLVVPGSHSPRLPDRAMLTSDIRPEMANSLDPFLGVLSRTNQQLAILDSRNDHSSKELIQKLTDYGINASLVPCENNGGLENTLEFIRSNKVDMLFIYKRSRNFLERLFKKEIEDILPFSIEVPVLMLTKKA